MILHARDIARLPAAGLVAAIVVGFLGRWVPGGDSLAVFRPEMAALLILAGALAYGFGSRITPVAAVIVAVLAIGSVLRFWGEGDPVETPDFVLRQHNMLFNNMNRGRLVQALVESDADVLALQEVGYFNTEALRDVTPVFDSYHFCRYKRGGVAVLARGFGPQIASGCSQKTEIAWLQLETDVGPVTFASLHLRWPWPKPQYWQVGLVEEALAQLPRPVILAGDFNMVPWAAAIARIEESIDGRVGRGLLATYDLYEPWPAVRIDNVIAPRGAGLHVERMPKMGSDHYGLVARIRMP